MAVGRRAASGGAPPWEPSVLGFGERWERWESPSATSDLGWAGEAVTQ